MKLYHGTSGWAAERIREEGILTRGKKNGNWKDSVESCSSAVYLTTSYPFYHAFHCLQKNNIRCAVIEIETDRLEMDGFNLVPDEDVLEQLERAKGQHDADRMKEMTRFHRDHLGSHRGMRNWEVSLLAMGTCAHIGEIPVEAITKIIWVYPEYAKQIMLDATNAVTTLQGFRFVGHRHWSMLAACIGMDDDAIRETLEESVDAGILQSVPVDYDLLEMYRHEAQHGGIVIEQVNP